MVAMSNGKPVSVFCACFFALLFWPVAILWALKMGKTIRWVSLNLATSAGAVLIQMVLPFPFGFVVGVLSYVLPTYFMYRWTTEYNQRYATVK